MRGGRLREQMTQVFARIEHEIIPKDEKIPPGQHLFSVLVGPGAAGGFDCEKDETAYCQRIDVQDEDGSTVQIVLACGCAERPEWAFLLHYLVDAAAERLRIILLERKGAFLLGSDFCFSSSGNRPEDADTVAGACLSVAYHQIAQEIVSAFQLSFDVMDQLSLTNYEQEGAEGMVLVAPREQIDKSNLCIWQDRRERPTEFSPEQTRFVRKLLAGSAPDALLFAASPGERAPQFCGVVSLTAEGGVDEGLRSNCVQVSIYGPMNWELSLFGRPVCLRNHAMGFRLPRGCSRVDTDKRAKARIEAVLREEFDQPSPGGPLMFTGAGFGRPPSLVQLMVPSSETAGVKVAPSAPGGPWMPWAPSAPAGPAGPGVPFFPSEPAGPWGPGGPWGPAGPGSPCGPCSPGIPWMPWGPASPAGPGAPSAPAGPAGPWGPASPLSPFGPGGPSGPWGPGSPWGPGTGI